MALSIRLWIHRQKLQAGTGHILGHDDTTGYGDGISCMVGKPVKPKYRKTRGLWSEI